MVKREGTSASLAASWRSMADGFPIGDMGRARFLFGHGLRGSVNLSLFTWR